MIDAIKNSFNNFVQRELNEQQRAAVLQKDGALLIIAGAGSGKTRVITSRIAHMIINEKIEPRSIVALTFTNKAAGEMKERLINLFQAHYQLPFIGTFHSYCLLQLRTHPTLLQFPSFSILDADDQLDLIKKISKKYALAKHITPSSVCSQISNYKNKMVGTDNPDVSVELFSPLMREIYLEYETEKSRAHCFDFDDLILTVLQLLKNNKTFKQQFQTNVRHILIDEYQDTSQVQHNLLLSMALNAKKKLALDSLCVVGDEDQSIYSWRGATVANMLKFQQDFAPVTCVKIEQNYRSVQPILEAANDVIGNNRLRNPKNLWSTRAAKNRLLVAACQSGDQEASFIAILLKCIAQKKKLNNVAILYRTHFQSRSIEEALIHHAIPYRIIGGIRFYERKEIKDLLAYLRLVLNPYDKISALRIINTPSRGLGQKFEDSFVVSWTQNPLLNMKQLIDWLLKNPDADLGKSKQTSLREFLEIFQGLDTTTTPSALLDTILARTRYLSYLADAYDMQEAQTKIENVQEFVQAVMVFERKFNDSSAHTQRPPNQSMLEAFLHEVALLQEKIEDEKDHNFVQMMTLHAAKGLEFDTVIIAGLEEGLLPSSRSLNTNEDLEEERRLMYVGMTRAKEHLVLFNAASRFTFGQIIDYPPSRFLKEIPRALVQIADFEEASPLQARSFFERWLYNQAMPAPAPTPKPVALKPTFAAKPKALAQPKTPGIGWAKNQTVYHQKFGAGLVAEVERAPEQELYVTVMFKGGKKKILSRFLQKM